MNKKTKKVKKNIYLDNETAWIEHFDKVYNKRIRKIVDQQKQLYKQELREKIRKIVDKADVPNWNAEDVSNAFNQLKKI